MGERQFRAAGWTKAGRQEASCRETGRQETGCPETSYQETGSPETSRQETGFQETDRQEIIGQQAGQSPQRAVTGAGQKSRQSENRKSQVLKKLDQIQTKIERRWKPQGWEWTPAPIVRAGFQPLALRHGYFNSGRG